MLAALLFAAATPAAAADTPGKDGFLLALPGYEFAFPRDHGTHDAYKTEWWYYTGNLRATSGRRYGFELTFFRVGALPPDTASESRWDLRNVALAHFAVTDANGRRFRFHEKLNRVSPFTASAATGYLDVFNEGWRASTNGDGSVRLVAEMDGDAIDLTLRSHKAPAVHGENGISVKAAGVGFASHYYSMTRLEAVGVVGTGGKRESCHGTAWMDHEFGSSSLRETQQGWDWFSVQLDNGTELMLYVIRRADGSADVTSSGSLITAEGSVIHLTRADLRVESTGRWHSRASGATYPMGWRISVPKFGLVLVLKQILDDQELRTKGSTNVTYWEGAVDVDGAYSGTSVRGDGYVEMTGYDRPFKAP